MTERKADHKQEGSEVKAVPVPFALGEIKENININLNTANKPSKEQIINQKLQQGIAAHKEGKLQEAEHIYRAILQTQPLHPDANHNVENSLLVIVKFEMYYHSLKSFRS